MQRHDGRYLKHANEFHKHLTITAARSTNWQAVISTDSVRHHIAKLQADGLVASEEERHGVGRPRQIYYLTESGIERFPTRYLRLTVRLLEQVKEHMPAGMVSQLFLQMASDLVQEYSSLTRTEGLSTEERLDMVKNILKDEGFNIEWEQIGDHFYIREVSCPYLHVGQNHPEICHIDQTLISSVLNLPTEKVQCVLDGDSHCIYVVPNVVSALIPRRIFHDTRTPRIMGQQRVPS
jgi:predicted ArsR family transcriptional regulator